MLNTTTKSTITCIRLSTPALQKIEKLKNNYKKKHKLEKVTTTQIIEDLLKTI